MAVARGDEGSHFSGSDAPPPRRRMVRKPIEAGPGNLPPRSERPDQGHRTETQRPDQGPADQGRTEQGRPEQGRPEQARPDQSRPDHGRPDHGRPDHGQGQRYERNDRGNRYDRPDRPDGSPRYPQSPSNYSVPVSPPTSSGTPTKLDDLYRLPMPKLFAYAEKEGITEHTGMNRSQLIIAIVRRQIERGVPVKGSGTLEVLPDGYGFLRSSAHSYLASPEDIYVSPSQIRRVGLRTGLIVEGPIRLPVEGQDNFALMQVDSVNGHSPEERMAPTNFEDLTPVHPNKRLILESSAEEINMRVIDLVTPIGKGQRGLIVSPPRAGKTILLQKIALSLIKNNPECYLIVLLVDERPEEVTDMARNVAGPNCEVVASTFDEPSGEHIHVSEIVLEKAKRLVEHGRDVIILLDSITRLARAYNGDAPPGGKLLSGGLDTNAMQKPKRFFGAARQVEEGGSLTILATALIDTNSRMDEVIFEEFKGTGNMELHLDRRLVEKRVWPAIDINRSGTRKEELLTHPEAMERVRILRRVLSDMHPVEAMEMLVQRLRRTKSNAEFLMSMNMS